MTPLKVFILFLVAISGGNGSYVYVGSTPVIDTAPVVELRNDFADMSKQVDSLKDIVATK